MKLGQEIQNSILTSVKLGDKLATNIAPNLQKKLHSSSVCRRVGVRWPVTSWSKQSV